MKQWRKYVVLLSLTTFRPADITFLVEYCKVMKPIATALDKLQGENNCYAGFIVPAIISLTNRLQALKQEVRYCPPLVDAVLTGIQRRFGDSLKSDDLIVAAVTLPQCRLRWCADDTSRECARNLLKCEMTRVQSHLPAEDTNSNQPVDADTDDDFYIFSEDSTSSSTVGIDQELEAYLNDDSKSLNCLMKYPVVKEVFVKYNTGIPSSAPVERMFSAGGQIFTPRRN